MLGQALDLASDLVIRNLPAFTRYFPKAYSEGGFYAATENVDWTTGFWTGEVWLAYEHTGKEELLKAGMVQMTSFLERIEQKRDVGTHGVGSPGCRG